ncbi:glycosyltransferase family 4 protein [Methylocella sp.]|uniref:glycosyltransferase family 4 protein n=1 Tax=Methylocella sp. TaxID=1978226 RepID=UPI0037847369
MRALLINTLYPTPGEPKIVGGAEIFVRALAEGLAAAGDEVEVVRAAHRAEPHDETQNGVVVRSAPVDNIYAPFAAARPNALKRLVWHALDDWRRDAAHVARRIEAFRPDVVHTHTLTGLTTGVWDAAAVRGVPVVHTLHDYYLTCPRSIRFRNGRSCARSCVDCRLLTTRRRRACETPSAVIGVSRRILDIHQELGLFRHTAMTAVIRHAVERIDAPPLRPRLAGAAARPLALGYIGRVTQEKGVENLARAIALLPPGSVTLALAGRAEDSAKRRLKALAPEADLRFLGFVRPLDFYRQVDVVAAPSIWEEPAGLVIAEAQAAGRPVLSTRYGGVPEGVRDGVAGWLTNGEPEDLAARLKSLIDDPSQILRAARACEAARGERGFGAVVDEHRSLYARVAGHALAPVPAAAAG